ncbi:MAG: MOSC domain-containing protein [Pseudomonadota bacterium]
MNEGRVAALHRYPVKGLSAEVLSSVTLTPGDAFPADRVLGFARHNSGFDPADPQPMQKQRFYVLMCDADLATLKTGYDEASDTLTLSAPGKAEVVAPLSTPQGEAAAVDAIMAHLSLPEDARPMLARCGPHRFTDQSLSGPVLMRSISLINRQSVAALGKVIGMDVDPMRFRGNILIDGWPAMSELDMMEKTIAIGPTRLKIIKPTRRCAATEVNLETAERDIDMVGRLMATYGHAFMGVFATVLEGGEITPGDTIQVV